MSKHATLLIRKSILLMLFPFGIQAQTTLKPVEVQVTPYKTTMLANGRDKVLITAKIIDSKGNEVLGLTRPVVYKISGDASIISINGAKADKLRITDST